MGQFVSVLLPEEVHRTAIVEAMKSVPEWSGVEEITRAYWNVKLPAPHNHLITSRSVKTHLHVLMASGVVEGARVSSRGRHGGARWLFRLRPLRER